MRNVAFWLFLSLAPLTAHAQTVMTMGIATSKSCGSWLEAKREADTLDRWIGLATLESWIFGFISGAAIYGDLGDPLGRTDYNGVIYWITTYCQSRPADRLVSAARAFIKERSGVPAER